MLNSYINLKKQIDPIVSTRKEDYIKQFLKQINYYVEKIIDMLKANTIQNEKISVLIKDFFNEISNFLTICKNEIEGQDIEVQIKIIKELISELDKQIEKMNQADIMDINAEMKLFEDMLKEDGYFEDIN